MNTKDLIDDVIEVLGDEYTVINGYNQEDEIDLNGALAVVISNVEILPHSGVHDKIITVNVNGSFLTAEDLTQQKIQEMADYVSGKMETTDFTEVVENCVGFVLKNYTINSDGETNNLTYTVDFVICED